MILSDLYYRKKISPPSFVVDSCVYLTVGGSHAYGCSLPTSDLDCCGICIPPLEMIFPHTRGEIVGFGTPSPKFDQWKEQHIYDNKKEYDFSVFGIVRAFQLLMENNPNHIDTLYTPKNCILYITPIGEKIRLWRDIFLHKGCYAKFRGYAKSQLHKMKGERRSGKRLEIQQKYGWDLKFGLHLVRLLLECEQILTDHTLDLRKDSTFLREIRNGEWEYERVLRWAEDHLLILEEVYKKSTLRERPNEDEIKSLLLSCLEEYFGDLRYIFST